jgi:hypothetical protein
MRSLSRRVGSGAPRGTKTVCSRFVAERSHAVHSRAEHPRTRHELPAGAARAAAAARGAVLRRRCLGLCAFKGVNAATSECTTELGALDRALPVAVAIDAARGDDHADAVVEAGLRCSWLVDPLLAAARLQRVAHRAVLLFACRGLTKKPATWSRSQPLSAWTGVARDLSTNTFALNASSSGTRGVFDIAALPTIVTELSFASCALTGTVDLRSLSPYLLTLVLMTNRLTGEAALDSLPPHLHALNLAHNQFSGGINLDRLPNVMHYLRLNNNLFEGEVRLERLSADPGAMEVLDLSGNAGLTGTYTGTSPYVDFKFTGTGIVVRGAQ